MQSYPTAEPYMVCEMNHCWNARHTLRVSQGLSQGNESNVSHAVFDARFMKHEGRDLHDR